MIEVFNVDSEAEYSA